jgi:hypothetical protein
MVLNADESAGAGTAEQAAQAYADAALAGDFPSVADRTYPALVEFMGGREKLIAASADAMKTFKARGFAIQSVKASAPAQSLSEGEKTYAVVPTTMQVTAPGEDFEAKSYLLAISSDQGKTWTFMDGGNLVDPKIREKLLGKFPEKLKLPVIEKPQQFK